jgi:hypothetical protein
MAHLELPASKRRRALEAFGSGCERNIRRIFVVALGCGYGVGLVVLRGVGRVARVGFGIQV